MISRGEHLRIWLRVSLLFGLLCLAAFLVLQGRYLYASLLLPLLIWIPYRLFRLFTYPRRELDQFVEAIQYRDFSRHFDEGKAPAGLTGFRSGFNRINAAFRSISRERETQHQYLRQVMDLVDTGILSYEQETGRVQWMNEAARQLLGIPYLRTIHALEARSPVVYAELVSLRPGERRVVPVQKDYLTFHVVMSARRFQIQDETSVLVALQHIGGALDEAETVAWQKLLGVMTHEIMNSVAPVSSLADTLRSRLAAYIDGQDDTALGDLELGLETIRRRSEGLMRFSDSYRNLSRVGTPQPVDVQVWDLLENLRLLMQPSLDQKQIRLDIVLQDNEMTLRIDRSLIEQVLINLLLNAVEAVRDTLHPRIILSAGSLQGRGMCIRVSDNGVGIPAGLQETVFVPFFSTRKNGNGIGLNLCRQIMSLHRGRIQLQSSPGEGTVFTLWFEG